MQQSEARWQPGETIVMQDVWRGQLWTARPMTVVADEGDFLALWSPKGTLWKGSVSPPTRPRADERLERILSSLELCDWVLQDRELRLSLLWLIEAGAGFATTLSWPETGEPGGWYVNLQEPFRRTPSGLQTMDLMLDVVVRRDGTWFWKDEDEFEAALKRGLLTPEKASWLREEAMRAIAKIEAKEHPVSEAWASWRPDPSWVTPVLPDGWERL